MAKALLENEVNYMRCSLCDNFLSIPPIMILSADGTENQCGRCKTIKRDGSTRNQIFETLAKHLSFPCIYKNCHEKIMWSEVEEHEKYCKYKSIQCPVYYQHDCKEVVEISQFETHMQRRHSTNIFYGNVFIKEIKMQSYTVSFVKADNEKFLVYLLQDCIFVGSLGPVGKYTKYDLKISTVESRDKSISFNNQPIVEFDERVHCYRCKRGLCNMKHHVSSLTNAEKSDGHPLFVDRNFIAEFYPNTKTLVVNITLIPEDLIDLLGAAAPPIQAVDIEKLLDRNSTVICQSLECVVCFEYMVGHIYSCESGHLVCKPCKRNLRRCPLCKVQLGDMRCRLAENISKEVEIACPSVGCNFIGSLEKLSLHERACPGPRRLSEIGSPVNKNNTQQKIN